MTSKWGWVSKQLAEVKASKRVEETTVELLRVLDVQTDKHGLTDDETRTVLDYVHKLALKHALVAEKPDEKWVDVIPGEYNIGDTVRVKAGAYQGSHGERHNGKRGRVAAVHQSKTVVIYDDAPSSEESFYHEPFKLQRLV